MTQPIGAQARTVRFLYGEALRLPIAVVEKQGRYLVVAFGDDGQRIETDLSLQPGESVLSALCPTGSSFCVCLIATPHPLSPRGNRRVLLFNVASKEVVSVLGVGPHGVWRINSLVATSSTPNTFLAVVQRIEEPAPSAPGRQRVTYSVARVGFLPDSFEVLSQVDGIPFQEW